MINKLTSYIVIVVLIIAVWFLLDRMDRLQENNERLLFNLEQSFDSSNTEILKLTKSELRKFNSDTILTALMDSFDIKFRNVVRVHKEKYYYNYDTTIKLVQTINDSIWDFSHKFDNCVSVKGYVDMTNKELRFDDLKLDYNSTTAYFWVRPKKFWFVHYGKKKYYLKSLNNCNNESTINEIEITK